MYTEDYKIKYGHINNIKIKDLTVKELKNLKNVLSHNKLLSRIIAEVLKDKTTINVKDELEKLLKNTVEIEINNKEKNFENVENSMQSVGITLMSNDLLIEENDIKYAIEHGISAEYINQLFQNFKTYYMEKKYKSRNWKALWKTWVDKNENFTPTLKKKKVDLIYEQSTIEIAKSYINEKDIEIEFRKFINYYTAKNNYNVNWMPIWENWCIRFQGSGNQNNNEQKDYRWKFKKDQSDSDKIKDWLDFDIKLDWKEVYYWKDIRIFTVKTKNNNVVISWKKVMHPDFNKEEILLSIISNESYADTNIISIHNT